MVEAQRTILIADDDDDIRSIIESAVGTLGFGVCAVADGRAALEVCERQLPDLAILDLTMPHMSGLDVCRRLKAMAGGAFVPVLFLTARDGVRDKVDALDGGGEDYLTKPFHYQELQARVRALMRVRELTLALHEKNRQLEEVQAQLVAKERQLVAHQLAGTAAHKLGQPLAAIMLNCHLLESLPATDERYQKALQAIKLDSRRMGDMIERLRSVDAAKTEAYEGRTTILDIES